MVSSSSTPPRQKTAGARSSAAKASHDQSGARDTGTAGALSAGLSARPGPEACTG